MLSQLQIILVSYVGKPKAKSFFIYLLTLCKKELTWSLSKIKINTKKIGLLFDKHKLKILKNIKCYKILLSKFTSLRLQLIF